MTAAVTAIMVVAASTPAWAAGRGGGSERGVDATVSARATQHLHLSALRFARSSVNASAGTAKVGLFWTITDTARKVTSISGAVRLGVPGTKPGTFASATFTVRFTLRGTHQVKVSGNARRSRYRYTFHVPRYAQLSPARWRVIRMTVHDNRGGRLALSQPGLRRFHAVLSASDLVDTSAPSYQDLAIYENQAPVQPYLYVGRRRGGVMVYQFTVQDNRAGLGNGSIQVSGPGGHTITSRFSYQPATGECGEFRGGGGPTDVTCGIPVTYPAGSPAGQWSVSELRLTDAAGNTVRFSGLGAAPITVTSDRVVQATHIKASPNPVNNWTPGQFYTVQLSMVVSGARNGISAVYVDTLSNGYCQQTSTVPTVSGNTVSVPVRIDSHMSVCQITGIAIADGSGGVALYGDEYYGAPDPYLLIRQVPDTTPPVATSASLSQSTIASSQTGQTPVTLTIGVTAQIAPVNGLSIYIYDSSGNVVGSLTGGISEINGTVTTQLPLSYGMAPGTYTIGFTINDAGGLSSSYGPGANPMPGGPLQLVVTPG